MHILASTLEMLGTVFIAYTALKVHMKLRKDHRIDAPVINEINHEEIIAIIGIIFIIVGYFIQVFL